ncbi:unnamed protein product, partial [Symbiodinium sp. CCMP2592]
MCLTSPCHGARIPVGFSNNTLVCKGVIRSIQEPQPSAVRVIKVRLTGLLDRLIRSTDFFQEIAPGVHATSLTSKHLVDLSLYLPYEGLAYRTTLIKIDGDWVLSELSSSIADLGEDLTTQVADQEVEMIVFGHREPLAPSDLGFATDMPILDAPAPAPPVSSADPVFEDFFGEAMQEADVELGGGAEVESAGGAAAEAAGGGEARDGALDDAVMQGALADEREAQPDKIVVDDVELSLDSTLSVLRRACQSLGVGKSGSKAVVFRRLCNQLDRLKLIEASRAAEVPNAPVPNVPAAPKEPTPEQRRAHEAVHAPYEAWCQHCVAFKARDDMHKAANTDRKFPVISFDYGFTGRSEEDGPHNKLAFLCLHDSESGWREAIPVPGKAGVHDGINVTSYLAAEICRLLSMLGYSKVVLQCDPEPTCLKLRNEVRRMRLQLGLQTDVQQSAEESHQSNGGAEVAVQTLRQQCNTLLSMYEAETKLKVATAHALHSWCLRHSSWILNRFVLRPGGLTPFEIIHGRPYKGKVLPFGETVMGLVSPGPKGKPRFIQAIMIGKCTPNDEFILCSGAGKLMLARTLTTSLPFCVFTILRAGVHDGINVTSYLAAEICRLLSMLGYSKVVLQCDPEPTCLKLRNEVRRMRLQLGLQTDVQQSAEESHQSNGGAEVAVQTLRQQCNTLLSMYEAETKLKVATAHALHSWCLRHSSWILNRFVLRPGGLTPFEIIHGRPYKGKVLPFGETVMGLVSPGPKGKPRFIQAIMIGKCTPNDEFILCSGAGKLMLARTVRRLATGFTPALHDCVRDPPWRHPGFVAGSLGRSRAQRKPKVLPAGGDARLVVEDQLGGVSDLLGELAALPEGPGEIPEDARDYSPSQEAASDPESSSQMSEDDPDGHRSGEAAAPASGGTDAAELPLQSGAPVAPQAVATGDPLLTLPLQLQGNVPGQQVRRVLQVRARIAAATVCGVEYHHADEDSDLAFSPADIESINDLDGLCSDDEEEECEQGLAPPDELYRPFSPHEPALSPEELADLDALCDHHEIARLKAMGVIYQPESGNEDCKSLTVKFVRSWRPKTHPVTDAPVWLRRSRLVAREFRFRDPLREGLYSPASQTVLLKLLPGLYMSRKGYALLSCDISDAYLTCEQPCPTVVTLHGTTYRLAFMLPGQRDGSAALFAMRNHSGGGLLHVDDLLGSGEHAELQRLAQIIESKYKCTLEWLVCEGDSLHFLKRKHTLARQDLLCIQKADKHIMKLVELLQLERHSPKPTPLPLQTLDLAKSEPLPEDQVSVYRSCIGILMYISADTADMQHSIRMLSQHLACPTEACMKALKHLVRYAKSTSGFCLGLERTHAGHGTRVQCDTGADVLELYTDSDWASDHTTRRSVSAGALYLNGNAIYTASRTQRVVAMSSCESELNALVSFAVDLMYVKEALRFIVGVIPESHAFSDSSSARAVVNKQGLSKLKHVEIRLLWVQQALKDGAFKLHPVGTLDNSSDLMTKVLKRERMLYLMYLLNIRDGDAQFNRVGEAQAVARDNNLSLKLAVKAVKAFRGPPQRVHSLLQALTFMSLIDANQARMLDSESRPHVLESALSGCGFILVCIGCLAVLCMSLQGCQAEIADELPDPWVV